MSSPLEETLGRLEMPEIGGGGIGGGNTVRSRPVPPSCLAYCVGGGKRRTESPTCETGVGVGRNEGSEPS